MKSIYILFIFLFITTLSNSYIQDTWGKIENKTWYSPKPTFGSQIVFLKNKFDEKKAIFQLHGSGCYVIATQIYDVQINDNLIKLTSDDPDEVNKVENQLLVFQYSNQNLQINEIEGKLIYKIFSEEPLIYKLCATKVDVETLKNDTITMNNFR